MDLRIHEPDFVSLYRQAFADFGISALWSSRPVANPTAADALAITNTLRVECNMSARRLAEQIEAACQQSTRPLAGEEGARREAVGR